jgi:hypothetical protein
MNGCGAAARDPSSGSSAGRRRRLAGPRARLPAATSPRNVRLARSRAGVAQLAERLICNQQVKGSSPLASSSLWSSEGLRPRPAGGSRHAKLRGGGRRGGEIRRYSSRPLRGEVSGRPKSLAQQADRTEDFGRAVAAHRTTRGGDGIVDGTGRGACRFSFVPLRASAPNNGQRTGDSKAQQARAGRGCRVRAERYRSGQTGQTVNLLANAFGGSNPPLSTTRAGEGCDERYRRRQIDAGIAQLARARAFQARGRGFESRFPLQITRGTRRSRSSVGRARPW